MAEDISEIKKSSGHGFFPSAAFSDSAIEKLNHEVVSNEKVRLELEQARAQNQFLLKELQHRVQNNIQIQISLLEQQAAHTSDQRLLEFANKANQRLCGLSQSLKVMYQDDSLSHVCAEALLTEVLDHLRQTFGKQTDVQFKASCKWLIPNDHANACALILNELVINAFTHGLKGGPGKIHVCLSRRDKNVILEISDSGKGFVQKDCDQSSFGLLTVQGLSSQIGARFVVDCNDGCVCRLIVEGAAEVNSDAA